MNLSVRPTSEAANAAAADLLAGWLQDPAVRTVMVAAGNTPLDLYRRIGERRLDLSRLFVFALDEYVGVPVEEPRNCGQLLRRAVQEAWGLAGLNYFSVSPVESEALKSVREHERRIQDLGGLDLIVLGLGQNGHLGFNEPGSAEDSEGRVLDLDPISTEANRKWFGGDYAPSRGVTVGLRTILNARRVLLLAYGAHKREAVKSMIQGPRSPDCPASLLQGHPETHVFLDAASSADLTVFA